MILQPSLCEGKSVLLCGLLTKGLHQKTAERSANTKATLSVSKRRRQLNTVLEELRGLGEVPVPRRQLRVAPVYKRQLLMLRPDDGDITPLLYGQLVDLASELQTLVGSRDTFSWPTIEKLRKVLLGSNPTVGHVDALGDFRELVCVFPSLLNRDSTFFTTNYITSFLCTPKTPEECEDFLTATRSSLLLKILEVTAAFEKGDESAAWLRLNHWALLDLAVKLGATSKNDWSRVIGSFLEVLALTSCSKLAGDCSRPVIATILLDAVLADTWQQRSPVTGWMGLRHLLGDELLLSREAFLPTIPEDQVVATQKEFLRGIRFGSAGFFGSGPKNFEDRRTMPLPGPLIVQKGLLPCLMLPQWLCPDSVLRCHIAFSEVPQAPLAILVKRANKEYQKATRLVNKTLKLVTELAAEEGIQLSEEENARLLEDIDNSDRRGVMSRAWESSPIKGSVPSMIQDFTKRPFSRDVHIPSPIELLVRDCFDHPHAVRSVCVMRIVSEIVCVALVQRHLGPSVNYQKIRRDFAGPYEMALQTDMDILRTLGLEKDLLSALTSCLVRRHHHPVPQRLPKPSLIVAYKFLAQMFGLPPELPICTEDEAAEGPSWGDHLSEAVSMSVKKSQKVPPAPVPSHRPPEPPPTSLVSVLQAASLVSVLQPASLVPVLQPASLVPVLQPAQGRPSCLRSGCAASS
ncbi:MAG: uncharacterized protein KVP18_000619, partial [Porospora cf. gigantea A]|uniref:uncharacterized protein n=2 Tax=Porospora cf. gigantea A TaxID=2853593 RepID=UPI0035596892